MGPICRNYAVDVVVRYYLQQAMDVGAEIDVKLELPERVGIPDSDLTIIFGNLFENAVLAVVRQTGGKRFITARCILRNGMLILALDNSMEPEPGQSGRRQPYKGVGQTSVEGVVQKYCGTVRFEAEKDIYRVSVLLYLNHREETEPVDGKPLP